ERLGVAADNQRQGKGPGLRGEMGDAAARDAGLLLPLAPYRLLDVLARFDEAGEARPHGRGEARRAPEQAMLALHRQHDDDRIGARKMLGPARRTLALPAALDRVGRGAAVGAEAMARVPGEQRLRLGDRRQ